MRLDIGLRLNAPPRKKQGDDSNHRSSEMSSLRLFLIRMREIAFMPGPKSPCIPRM
jgi:hypothetical protein